MNHTAEDPHYGKRLAKLRGRITQKEMAAYLGITPGRYSQIERSPARPAPHNFTRLARFYALTESQLQEYCTGVTTSNMQPVSMHSLQQSFLDLSNMISRYRFQTGNSIRVSLVIQA